ncbi:MAG: putative LPS assembly protein LptD [Bacteroidota bacterium]
MIQFHRQNFSPLKSFLLSCLLTVPCLSFAQQADTTQTATSDSAVARDSGVDTLVVYSAKDSIVYSLRTRFMNLYGNSEMQYRALGLKAERVGINWDTSTLVAIGVPDTSKPDSTIGQPVMKDGGETYDGERVTYNFRSKKGKITVGKTQIENGHYRGDEIKKIESNTLFVEDGIYTTCDAEHPHFYFYSPKMKVMVRDKVVAEPVFFYIADVPLFALPFGVFPSHGGRTSGIIAPAYGEDNRYGKYLSHLGYYWAVSDYVDVSTMFDLYSRGGWLNRSFLRYNLRYDFSGSISTNVTSLHEGESGDPQYVERRDYNVNWTHSQVVDPSPLSPSRLDVNFTFASGSYFRNFSASLNEILQQNIISNATFSKTWGTSNRSLTINIARDQSLTNGDTRELLPSVSFSQGQIFPFRKKTKSRGLGSVSDEQLGFFDLFGINYSANVSNSQSKISQPVDSIRDASTSLFQLGTVTEFQKTKTQAVNQNVSLSLSPKFGNFTVSPSISFSDQRTFTQLESPGHDTSYSLVIRSDKQKTTGGFLSTGVSTSTRLFGIFQPQLLGITSVRHTLTPTFGLSYNKKVYGENIPKYSMLGSLSVGNNFEMKYQGADTGQEKKIQLANIGASINYDFARDSLRFSELGLNYRTDIGQYLNISGGAQYNLYQYDPAINSRVNKFLLSESGKLGDLTSFSLSLGTSLRGEKKQHSASTAPANVQQEQARASGEEALQAAPKKIFQSIYDREEADFSIPWNITFNYTFSESRPNPSFYSRTSSLSSQLSFNLTEKWQISTSASYDFVSKKHYIPYVSVTRDLHCWSMSFEWNPMGIREGYRFELKVKAPQLQDLKVTKQSSVRGIY